MRVVLSLLLGAVVVFLLVSLFLAALLHLIPGFIHALPWMGVGIVFGGAFGIIAWMGGMWGGSTER